MKKILIISQYIAPVQAIASVRWTKIAKYLKKKYDVEITILTNKKNFGQYSFKVEKKDPLLVFDVKYFDEYLETGFGFFYIWVKSVIFSCKKRRSVAESNAVRDFDPNEKGIIFALKQIINEIMHDIYYIQQMNQCLKVINKKEFAYDVIISTFGPIWTHMTAEKLKKKHQSVLWIADFRDPYVRESDLTQMYKKHQKYINKHLNNADVITKVFRFMKIYDRTKRTEVIPNGYDPEEALSPIKPQKFIFLYTGVIYEGRQNFMPLFRALRELLDVKVLSEEDVEIQYAGGCFGYLLKQAELFGVEELLVNLGYISRDQALKWQSEAAILFQAGWNTEKEKMAWTGKTYEYMMAQKPTIYLMSGNIPFSTVWELIPRLGGVCYEESRHEKTFYDLKNYIVGKYKEWKTTGNVTVDADKSYIEQFSYDNIAERVWDIIKMI